MAAVAVAVVVLLFRVARVPAWNAIYGEDYGVFLIQALAHPWHTFTPYEGYYQLVPRLIAQAAALLPIKWAAATFAVGGALVAAACALFSYHASSGYIRSPLLRAVLGASLILLPVAPLEVAANGVDTLWYLMAALFWAILWRPRTRGGMAAAAIVALAATASCPLVIVFTPLLAVRVFALRNLREHAVTAGWLVGWVIQAWAIALSYADHDQRTTAKLAPLTKTVPYYLHTVVLRAFGWHISWDLTRYLGEDGATAACGVVLAVILGWAMTTGRAARLFVILAVVSGFVLNVVAATITSYITREAPYLIPVSFEPASRYSVVPLLLLYAAAIVGVDAFAQRHGSLREAGLSQDGLRPGGRPAAMAAAVALVVILGAGWITDYSYPTQRTSNGPWRPTAARLLNHCHRHDRITLHEWSGGNTQANVNVPCSRLVS
jgi:hypothetical protein